MSDRKVFNIDRAVISGPGEIKPIAGSVPSEEFALDSNVEGITFEALESQHVVMHLNDKVVAWGDLEQPHTMLRAKLPALSEDKLAELKAWLTNIGGYIDGDYFMFPVELKP